VKPFFYIFYIRRVYVIYNCLAILNHINKKKYRKDHKYYNFPLFEILFKQIFKPTNYTKKMNQMFDQNSVINCIQIALQGNNNNNIRSQAENQLINFRNLRPVEFFSICANIISD
jgi:hypothetical protein